MQSIISIAQQFAISGTVVEVKPLGAGLINDTYLVVTSVEKYVLQRVNNAIFKDVPGLQRNIEVVTAHIRKQLEARGESDIDRKVLTLVPVCDCGDAVNDGDTVCRGVAGAGRTWIEIEGKFWRMTKFIEDAVTKDEVSPENAYFTGKAIGAFEASLIDVPETLCETIPDFHNMELRSRQLKEAVAADAAGRVAIPAVQQLLEVINEHDEDMCKAERMYREGILPKRICHCDAKVNNIMFDKNGDVLCVIDLDTMMPSFVFSDIGDFLRTAANTLPEDDPDIDAVDFKMDIFDSFVKGYLESASSFLTPVEKENIPYAALLFPYMQAVRFLADYINGDTYYKINRPDHNLERAMNQVALFKSALSKYDAMKEICR